MYVLYVHSNILAPRNNIHRSGNRERKRRIETFLKKSQFVVFVAIVQARFVKAKKSGLSVLPSSFLHSLNWASTWRFWSSSALVKLLPLIYQPRWLVGSRFSITTVLICDNPSPTSQSDPVETRRLIDRKLIEWANWAVLRQILRNMCFLWCFVFEYCEVLYKILRPTTILQS